MRRRARLRESPLAELFAATERRRRFDGRRGRWGASPFALIGPTGVAIFLVGIVAASALGISVWQLAHQPAADLTGAQVSEAGSAVEEPTRVASSDPGTPSTTAPAAEVPEPVPAPSPGLKEKPAVATARLVLTAARGDCWLEVRVGSSRGKVLFAGTLVRGETLRFVKRRLWLAFGAGGNLEVALNGKRVERFPSGTAAVLVTAQGVSSPVP